MAQAWVGRGKTGHTVGRAFVGSISLWEEGVFVDVAGFVKGRVGCSVEVL